jgi:hypothetical protein
MKGILSYLVRGTRDIRSVLAALVGPVHNIFFLASTLYDLSLSPSKLGRLPCLDTCL